MMYRLQLVFTFLIGISSVTLRGQEVISYAEIERQVRDEFEGKEVKGAHKLARRTLHYLKSHLDENGNIFNHSRANMKAWEQQHRFGTRSSMSGSGDWQFIGPRNTYGNDFNQEGLGRINHIAIASATTWYAGSAGGGLWRTDLAGIYVNGSEDYPWYPLTDNLPVTSISGIAVNPNDIDDLYILTGDGESITYTSRGTQPSLGIFHSTDGGESWSATAMKYEMTDQQAGYKLMMYPGDPDVMFAACTDGLYRTTDGWEDSLNISQPILSRVYDIEFKPGDPQTIYAAAEGALYRSTDGGITFPNIIGNLDHSSTSDPQDWGRMALAVSAADPEVVYVIIVNENNGLMTLQKSIDGGDSFVEKINNTFNILSSGNPLPGTGGQGNYDLALYANPDNASQIYVGGVNVWKSNTNGNAGTWTMVANWSEEPPNYTHADIHAIEANPFNGDVVVGTDGGIYSTDNGGSTWENRSRGIGALQFYHMSVRNGYLSLPEVYGGTQDNGSLKGSGIGDNVFEMIGGGDGFGTYAAVMNGFYTRYNIVQNGKLYASINIDGTWVTDNITPENQEDQGAWDTPYQPNPHNYEEIIIGYDNLFFSNDIGDDWVEIDLPSEFNLSNDALIEEIAWSEDNPFVVYFMVNDESKLLLVKYEQLYHGVISGIMDNQFCEVLTIIEGDTLFPLWNFSEPPYIRPVPLSDIEINPSDEREAWISFTGYTDGKKVYRNLDMASGLAWENMTFNLPNVPVHSLEYDEDGIFAGTDIGMYFLPHGTSTWIYFSDGLPVVAVTEVRVNHSVLGKQIFAATWGRGIWRSSPPTPARRTRWYVDDSANGANDGSSWSDAFNSLQHALSAVLAGDSIWVAEGFYYPDDLSGFHVGTHSVYIWGGFEGTESQVDERDYNTYQSILSGDIGIPGNDSDNASSVFQFGGHNSNVLLDGFDITLGRTQGTSYGGGIHYSTGVQSGKPVIRNCDFYDNESTGGGAIFIRDYEKGDPPFVVINCTFSDNSAFVSGGAIKVEAKSTSGSIVGSTHLILKQCTFNNNTANLRGGTMAIDAFNAGMTALIEIDSCSFSGSLVTGATGYGNGIFVNQSGSNSGQAHLVIENTEFDSIGGFVDVDGGAIMILAEGQATTTLELDNVLIKNCIAKHGAGILLRNSEESQLTLHINNSAFINDSASSEGGAMEIWQYSGAQAEITLNNSDFFYCRGADGGAIHLQGDLDLVLDSCVFFGNTADYYGGALYWRAHPNYGTGSSTMSVSNSIFQGNQTLPTTAASYGGAIDLFSTHNAVNVHFENNSFIQNQTSGRGGAISMRYNENANPTDGFSAMLNNCSFSQNSSRLSPNLNYAGGALAHLNVNVLTTNCQFENNEANSGGAIFQRVDNDTLHTHQYTDCTFSGNTAVRYGGAIYTQYLSPARVNLGFDNCDFTSNANSHVMNGFGGALALHNITARTDVNLDQCTFSDNFAASQGGALYIRHAGTAADSLLIFGSDCIFNNNDSGSTGLTVWQESSSSTGYLHSQWTDSEFCNDNQDLIFLNKRASGAITPSVARFINCMIRQIACE